MEIKAADVAKLRKMTGAGMMDCKAALTEAGGDYDKAKDIIREKGKLVADKRADRTATEGVVVTKITGSKGYMLCLACETDFVAKNDYFDFSQLNLGYDVPTDWSKRNLGIQYLQVSADLGEMFHISTIKRERGIDYPFARTYSLSLTARF